MTADRGTQLERTTLAWDRTALAFLVNGLLVVRLGRSEPVVVAGGLVVLVLGAVPLLTSGARHRRRDAALLRARDGDETAPEVADLPDLPDARPGVVALGLAALVVSAIALAAAVLATARTS